MPLCYVSDTLAYVYGKADVIAVDCMADVIVMFSAIEQMLSSYLAYIYIYIKRLMLLSIVIILTDVIAMLPYILQYQICMLQW